MLLSLPVLIAGLAIDDYFHRSILLGVGRIGQGANPLFDLFSFVSQQGPRHEAGVDLGIVGWWAHPDISFAFLRPLSALTHMLDYALWPDAVPLQHLHSLAWYGLAVFAVARFYREVHGVGAVAGLAAILYAVDDAHAMCVGWIANRHALVALAVGMFTLHAHVRWRRSDGALAWAVAASGSFVLALLCSEAALAVVAYVFAWELTMQGGSWKNRVAALVPSGVIVLVWHAVYARLGYGANGSALYTDPGHQPVDFLLALTERWPVLQLTQWLQVTSDVFLLMPRGVQTAWAVLGVAACVALARVFRPLLSESREARFWAVGSCLALVPLCAAFPMDRLLIFSGVGAFGLLALFVERAGLLSGAAGGEASGRRFAQVLVVLHGPLAAALLLARVVVLPMVLGGPVAAIIAKAPTDTNVHQQTFVFVNGLDAFVGYLPIIRDLESPNASPRRVTLLSSMLHDNSVYREAENTLVITAQGGFLSAAIERLMRKVDAPFVPGQKIAQPDFTAEVRSITPDGRPLQVAFTFHAPLESAEYRWLTFRQTDIDEFHLPPVGGRIDLPGVHILPRSTVELRALR